jgi:proteasome lid subunit RPN8/RPN11
MFKVSIHDEFVLICNGRKFGSIDDEKILKDAGIINGDSLFIGVYTPPLPSESSSFSLTENVEFENEVLEKCFEHARKHPYVEVAGVLIGKEMDGGKMLVVNSVPIAEGTLTSVILDPIKIADVADKLRGDENYIVGWYHSHIKSGPFMSGIDARLQSGYQKLYSNAVALILNPLKRTAEFYRVSVAGLPQPIGDKILNLPELKLISMNSGSITLTTILEEKEEAEISAFSGSDTMCGEQAVFSVTVKNVGTVPLSKAKVILHVTSPDGKESISASSGDINLHPGDSETYTLQCRIPVSWPSGSAIARASVRNIITRSWLCPLATTYITLIQPPIHKVKLIVYRTSQKVGKGQAAIYIVYVKNNGNRRDKIEIDWDLTQLPKLWKAKMYDGETEKTPPFSINLDAGATRKLILEVIPPPIGYAGDKAPVTIKAKPLLTSQ